MGVWYCTRENVKRALDSAETARNNAQVDRAIEASSRSIDGYAPGGGFLRRRFYPEIDTRYFDWPNTQGAPAWRLYLGAHELLSVSALTAGGVAISAADYFLEPANYGPPYTRVEVDLSSTSGFDSGSTHQRAIAIAGVFGHCDDQEPAGLLAEALDASETGVDVTDSAAIGVGDLIKVGSERMIVTEKTMITTGQTVQTTALTASMANVTVNVTTGSAYNIDETILIDSERMLIVDIAGNALTVKRQWDGSALAAHSVGATIYAPRTLTVTRGVLGTTAAAHDTAAAINRHLVPGLVQELCVAESLVRLLQAGSGYARTVGSGEGERESSGRGLKDLRDMAWQAYGRKIRNGAV